MELNNYHILVILSGVILISHFFNLLSKRMGIPSVLFLIGFGMLLKFASLSFNWPITDITREVAFLGSIGLIMIVLEGVLDLRIKKENFVLIQRSFLSSLAILVFSIGAIGMLFHWWLKADMVSAFVNAIPLAVISSAVVIPSIHHLAKEKRDFLTYEAVFSDILGIMLFNFMIAKGASSVTGFALQNLLVLIVSFIVSYFLILFVYQMKTKTKFFIILSLLVLVYALGELLHLSSLLLVFIFGLLLRNYGYISKVFRIGQFSVRGGNLELLQFKHMVDEVAFFIRTFFFIAFGYSVDLGGVLTFEVAALGVPIVLILLAVRFFYLNYIVRTHVFPEIFIAPKGLITIILFYSIPAHLLIPSISQGVLLFVILATSLLMIVGGGRNYDEGVS